MNSAIRELFEDILQPEQDLMHNEVNQRQLAHIKRVAQTRTPEQRRKWCVSCFSKIDVYDTEAEAQEKYDEVSKHLVAYIISPDTYTESTQQPSVA